MVARVNNKIHKLRLYNPDNKVHGAKMGPIWGRQDPGGPLIGPMEFAVWENVRHLAEDLLKLISCEILH